MPRHLGAPLNASITYHSAAHFIDLLPDRPTLYNDFSVTMAGPVRQPIDLNSLSTYIESHIPAIQLPISIKQVPNPPFLLSDVI